MYHCMSYRREKPRENEENISNIQRSLFREALIFLWEIIKVVAISLAIILPIRYFLIQPFYVKGASMEPNFYDHEYLIIDQISYRFTDPQRGDVVVFRYPINPRDFFIKRIIGLPGETIIIRNGKIVIFSSRSSEGITLEEPYLEEGEMVTGDVMETLGEDEYFLLGDNRDESLDSRVFGPVKRENIIGKVFFRGWPLNRIGFFFHRPQYGI